MARVLVLWSPGPGVPDEDVDGWAQRQLDELAACEAVAEARLHPVEPVSVWCPDWDRAFELTLREGFEVPALLERAPWRDLLLDMRLMGMRPAVVALAAAER